VDAENDDDPLFTEGRPAANGRFLVTAQVDGVLGELSV
jgi:hypothetical protein